MRAINRPKPDNGHTERLPRLTYRPVSFSKGKRAGTAAFIPRKTVTSPPPASAGITPMATQPQSAKRSKAPRGRLTRALPGSHLCETPPAALAASPNDGQNTVTFHRPDLHMLRYLAFLAAVSVLLMSALMPLKAESAPTCASTPAFEEVCAVPGTAPPLRVPAKKSCLTCAVPAFTQLPDRPAEVRSVRISAVNVPATGRPIRPDLRPPRA